MSSKVTSPIAYNALPSGYIEPLQNNTNLDSSLPPLTKIICTLGPATMTEGKIEVLMNAGMNVLRLNFSHGDHTYHSTVIQNARNVMDRTRQLCAVMLDTKGPEIRTGKLVGGADVELTKGNVVDIVCDKMFEGDSKRICVTYENLPKVIKVGNNILIDDGLISCTVQAIKGDTVTCLVNNTGMLGQNKGVNLPGVIVDLPAVTEKDAGDLRFGVAQGVDLIAASFIRRASDIAEIRKVLGPDGAHIQIIAKIENQEGLDNFDEILAVADGIMVARGDLGVEIPTEYVMLAQKMMIQKCNAVGKPVITATQMLESMVVNPSPTRAEASDVANAVLDGTDCVMLSGETAKGKYPVEAVLMMADICREAEAHLKQRSVQQPLPLLHSGDATSAMKRALAVAAASLAKQVDAKVLIVVTKAGGTARLLSQQRPRRPILSLTTSETTARQSLIFSSLFPLLVGSMQGVDSLVYRGLETAAQLGFCQNGDAAVQLINRQETSAGKADVLTVITVDL